MMISICQDCGCPRFGASSWHFKNCPVTLASKNKQGWWAVIDKKRVVDLMNRELKDVKSGMESLKESVERLENVMTDSCLDEVYLCIYDCIHRRLEAA